MAQILSSGSVSQFHMHPVPTQGHVVRRVSEFGPQEWEFLKSTVGAAVNRDMATWQFSIAAGADQHGLGICFPGDPEGGNLALDRPCKYTLQIEACQKQQLFARPLLKSNCSFSIFEYPFICV